MLIGNGLYLLLKENHDMNGLNRNCPNCNKIIEYKTKSQYTDATKKNRICKSCANRLRKYKGSLDRICKNCGKKYTFSSYGHYKKSILRSDQFVCKSCISSKIHKGQIISKKQRQSQREKMLGRKHTEETKRKISEKTKGKNNPCYGRCGKLNPMYEKSGILSPTYGIIAWNRGKEMSDLAKRNMRIAKLKRFERLGIQAGEDCGAKEWFDKYNKENNTNYKPKRFIEIGYDADGYDEKLHSWIEYDTPYHKLTNRQEKDIIRQNNIIKYFESINKPLNKFTRIITWKNNKEKIIYENKI